MHISLLHSLEANQPVAGLMGQGKGSVLDVSANIVTVIPADGSLGSSREGTESGPSWPTTSQSVVQHTGVPVAGSTHGGLSGSHGGRVPQLCTAVPYAELLIQLRVTEQNGARVQ